ncbi:MAG: 3'-5' exonuclease, partial [Bacilli bacterium]
KQTENPVPQPLRHLLQYSGLKPYQIKKVEERLALLTKHKTAKPDAWIRAMRANFYDAFVETQQEKHITQHKETLKEILSEAETSASRFESIGDFLHFIEMYRESQQTAKHNTSSDRITLSTIHRAKGLEWPCVFIIGANDNNLPHTAAQKAGDLKDTRFVAKKQDIDAGIEEERRLLYVAITRAKERLFICSPKFYQGQNVEVSRFLNEAYGLSDTKPQPNTLNTVVVKAYLCQSKSCNVFMRIKAGEKPAPLRECPKCNGDMLLGKKRVPLT